MFTIFQKLKKAVWTNKYMNDLPDSAFLYIESGGKKDGEEKTVPRELRHFPFKDIKGKIDLAHLRNAIARIPQNKCGLNSKQMKELQDKARKILVIETNKLNKGVRNMDKKNENGTVVGMELLKSFTSDLEKAEARGGKYIKREAKPGGGYKYYYAEDKKKEEKKGEIDKVLLDELEIHADNTPSVHDIRKVYDKLMVTKIANGTYDSNLASKGWLGYVNKLINNYEREEKMPKGSIKLSPTEKMILAKRFAKQFEQDLKNNPQYYKRYIPKKYADKGETKKSISDNMPIQANPPVLQPYEWMRRENAIYEREMTRDTTIDLKSIGNVN